MQHMENMVYMFLCPQGDTVYTDNPKSRGGQVNVMIGSLNIAIRFQEICGPINRLRRLLCHGF